MTTRALEDLDGGLGSCLPSDDLSLLEEPCPGRRPENKARGSLIILSRRCLLIPQDSVTAAAADARPSKMEKDPVAKGAPGPGPRSAPVRKKSQAMPPMQPPPPPPQALNEDLPWGDVTLNKCLVLASLVALLGSAFQLCRGESPPLPHIPTPPSPEASIAPGKLFLSPVGLAPPPGPPVPPAKTEDRPEPPQTSAAEKSPPKGSGEEETVPRGDRGSPERPRKKEKLRKERSRKEEKPRKERPWATKEPREALPRSPRSEAREGRHRPGARDPEHRKHQVWASPGRRDEDAWPPGRRKHRGVKGRD
uniref:Junctional sarcoplasmic reticulum protein 1 n=1 Tax=Jaculus jaculus TaxID=51337 RepID=A0A8C5L9T2_JACJA